MHKANVKVKVADGVQTYICYTVCDICIVAGSKLLTGAVFVMPKLSKNQRTSFLSF